MSSFWVEVQEVLIGLVVADIGTASPVLGSCGMLYSGIAFELCTAVASGVHDESTSPKCHLRALERLRGFTAPVLTRGRWLTY